MTAETGARELLDELPVLAWTIGLDRRVDWLNRRWLAYTGRTMADELGNGWTDHVHPEDLERCARTYAHAFDARTHFTVEYRLRRHDGEWRWMLATGAPRYGTDGLFSGYCGTLTDVDLHRRAEAALREADRRKDDYLDALAHELRNPLAPLLTSLELLRRNAAPEGAAVELLDTMERQIAQLRQRADELVELSRTVRGRPPAGHATSAANSAAATGIAAAQATAELAPPAATPRVLVVDDNRDAAETVRMGLDVLGVETEIAFDGESALALLAQFRPTLVILDIGMPGMDGHELARRIRADPGNSQVKLVALSGWGQEEIRRRSREAGIDLHLVKPLGFEELQRVIGISP